MTAEAHLDPAATRGARLVTVDGRTLPLRAITVRTDAAGGIARVKLEQQFVNPYDEPLRLTYLVPLPEDAAVSAYAFVIAGRRVVGRVEPRRLARERFERALIEGRTAALLTEERGSLFTQSLGNVPARASITCELTIDQPLVFLPEGAWEWRFPTVVAPRFLGAPGRTPDAEQVTVDVAPAGVPVTASLVLEIGDVLAPGGAVRSPSHALVQAGTPTSIAFASEAALDRDIVVRWPVARPEVGVGLVTGRPVRDEAAYGLLTIVPPSLDHAARAIGRDLCLLLDTSGSMTGAPLAQAIRVACALIDSLGDRDHVEMIEFGNEARRWRRSPVAATAAIRAEAIEWLRGLRASGGTDMTAGILASLAGVRADAQRQIVLITDGEIGFEQEVLRELCARLPRSSRLHAIGVGAAVNRSLTRPAARAGGGLEVLIGTDEDAERAASRIVDGTARPTITEVTLGGSALEACAPERPADVFAAAPAIVPVRLRPTGGELWVRGRLATGPFEARVVVAPLEPGSGTPVCATLFARERVADLELQLAAGGDATRLDAEIERIGIAHQITTRLTSFVAVTDAPTVDPTSPTRSEVVPHAWPYGMSTAQIDDDGPDVEDAAMPLRAMAERAAPALGAVAPRRPPAASPRPSGPPTGGAAPKAKTGPSLLGRVRRLFDKRRLLRGRVVLRAGGQLVVEIMVDAPLAWSRPRAVTTTHGGTLEVVQASADASLDAGHVIRLVLTDPEPATTITELDLDGTLTVALGG